MNKYNVEKIVGEGSYGKALLCRRKTDSKRCIIKQISIVKMSPKEIKQTEQESKLLSKFSHPNIVAFWESFSTGSHIHIVMEFADGGDLAKYLEARRGKLLSEETVLNIFVQISLALKHVHDRKILHRDLKTQNVFLTSNGLCKLGDFGVSRILSSTTDLAATQIGTPYYMSPEIMNGSRYNSKTDIWSLGCIQYELMCLKVPFDGRNLKGLAANIINSNPVPPSAAYSQRLRDLLMELLAKNPKKRPSINRILAHDVVKEKIKSFLSETKMIHEFSHTILHGHHVLRDNPPPLAPPSSKSSNNNNDRGNGLNPSSSASAASSAGAKPIVSTPSSGPSRPLPNSNLNTPAPPLPPPVVAQVAQSVQSQRQVVQPPAFSSPIAVPRPSSSNSSSHSNGSNHENGPVKKERIANHLNIGDYSNNSEHNSHHAPKRVPDKPPSSASNSSAAAAVAGSGASSGSGYDKPRAIDLWRQNNFKPTPMPQHSKPAAAAAPLMSKMNAAPSALPNPPVISALGSQPQPLPPPPAPPVSRVSSQAVNRPVPIMPSSACRNAGGPTAVSRNRGDAQEVPSMMIGGSVAKIHSNVNSNSNINVKGNGYGNLYVNNSKPVQPAVCDGLWLKNLESEMGILKNKVEGLKCKTPPTSSPPVTANPARNDSNISKPVEKFQFMGPRSEKRPNNLSSHKEPKKNGSNADASSAKNPPPSVSPSMSPAVGISNGRNNVAGSPHVGIDGAKNQWLSNLEGQMKALKNQVAGMQVSPKCVNINSGKNAMVIPSSVSKPPVSEQKLVKVNKVPNNKWVDSHSKNNNPKENEKRENASPGSQSSQSNRKSAAEIRAQRDSERMELRKMISAKRRMIKNDENASDMSSIEGFSVEDDGQSLSANDSSVGVCDNKKKIIEKMLSVSNNRLAKYAREESLQPFSSDEESLDMESECDRMVDSNENVIAQEEPTLDSDNLEDSDTEEWNHIEENMEGLDLVNEYGTFEDLVIDHDILEEGVFNNNAEINTDEDRCNALEGERTVTVIASGDQYTEANFEEVEEGSNGDEDMELNVDGEVFQEYTNLFANMKEVLSNSLHDNKPIAENRSSNFRNGNNESINHANNVVGDDVNDEQLNEDDDDDCFEEEEPLESSASDISDSSNASFDPSSSPIENNDANEDCMETNGIESLKGEDTLTSGGTFYVSSTLSMTSPKLSLTVTADEDSSNDISNEMTLNMISPASINRFSSGSQLSINSNGSLDSTIDDESIAFDADNLECLESYLQEKIGKEVLASAISLLQSVCSQVPEDDVDAEEAFLDAIERIVGPQGMQYLDFIYELVTLYSQRSESI